MRPGPLKERAMDILLDFLTRMLTQLQSPSLAFLIGGSAIAAMGSKLEIPNAVYQFIVFMLLMRIGINGGMEIREADLSAMALPALFSALLGILIVLMGRVTIAMMPGVKTEDGIATAGLFGAVSASTLAAAMVLLEEDGIEYEAWVPALYPFMDLTLIHISEPTRPY